MNKKYEDRQLSNIASHGNYSKGRKYKDSKLQFNRTEYQRDRDRILYSDAFKRLKHKTQVFLQNYLVLRPRPDFLSLNSSPKQLPGIF